MAMSEGRVFISHSAQDRARVDEILAFLEARGIPAWIAPRDVRPGGDYSVQLDEAIENCAAFLVVVSEAANSSRHVRGEIQMAFHLEKPIFPLRFEAVEPSRGMRLFLAVAHWTDAYGGEREASLERLARELEGLADRGAAREPRGAPPPPQAPSSPATRPIRGYWLYAAIGLALLAIAAIVWLAARPRDNATPDPAGKAAPVAEGVETTASGLRFAVVREGTGPLFARGDLIALRYEMRVGGPMLDGNMNSPDPMVTSGDGLIPGFAEALLHMRAGGVYRVWVPPDLGYGANVPAGAPFRAGDTLEFLVRVLQVNRGGAAAMPASNAAGGEVESNIGGM